MMSSMAPSLPSYTCRLSLTCRPRSSAISSCCCRLLLWEGDWEHAQGWSGWASGSPGLLPEPLTPIYPTNSHPVLSQGWEQPCAGCSRSMEKPGKDKVQLVEIRTTQHSTYLVFLLQTSQAAEHTLELSQPIPAPSIKTSRLFPGTTIPHSELRFLNIRNMIPPGSCVCAVPFGPVAPSTPLAP